MLQKRFNRGNAYFDSYDIWDTEKEHFVGVVEDHCRDVVERYFVGWKFQDNLYIPGRPRPAKTKMFDTYEEALDYIQEPFE